MKPYYDFSEPMPKREQSRKIEYLEEQEKFAVTSKHVRIPYSSEVISRIRRQPRAEKVSPLLEAYIKSKISNGNESNFNKNENLVSTHRVLSKTSEMARNAVFDKLGIKR